MITRLQQEFHQVFSGRWPSGRNALRTYGVIVFLVYSWTLFVSFYKLPSWLYFLNLNEILSIYAYSVSANFLESLFLMTGVLVLEYTVFLPLKNRDEFQTRSVVMVIVILACAMTRLLLYKNPSTSAAFVQGEWVWWTLSLLCGYALAVLVPRNRFLRNLIHELSERTVVFVYIYVPLSLLALLVVLARNIR